MINNWLTKDHRIHLPKLLEHLDYHCTKVEKTHFIYKSKNQNVVVLHVENGYVYYKVQRPEEKLGASNLIIEHVSKIEGTNKETVWIR